MTRYGIKFTIVQDDGTKRSVLRRRGPNNEQWTPYTDASKALRDALGKVDRDEWIDPSKQPLGEWLDTWVEGHRKIGDSTRASYRRTSGSISSRTSAECRSRR